MGRPLDETYCIYCGNEGKENGCPKCGRTPEATVFAGKSEESVAKTILYMEDKLLIPEAYLGQFWNKDILLGDFKDLVEDPSFIQYVGSLAQIDNLFIRKQLPKRSMLVMSPSGFSKKTLVYSCIQIANAFGARVSPLMSTLDIAFIIRQATEVNPNFKLNGVGYTDLYDLDLLSVYVAHTDFKYESYKVIQEILNMRNRVGRTTLVLSDFDFSVLTQWDDQKNFRNLFKYGFMDNKTLYPSVISYKRR